MYVIIFRYVDVEMTVVGVDQNIWLFVKIQQHVDRQGILSDWR